MDDRTTPAPDSDGVSVGQDSPTTDYATPAPRVHGDATPSRRNLRRRGALPLAVAASVLVSGGASFAAASQFAGSAGTTTTSHISTDPGGSAGSAGGGYGAGGGDGIGGGYGIGGGWNNIGSGGVGSGGSASSATGGPTDAATIAAKVDPGLVDIDTNLSYQGEEAAGTGMVLTSNGEILTNNHVIEGATSIRVTDIGNGKTYNAKVVGYDATHDVAVLQLTGASGLSTVTLGNSSSVKSGDAVVGIGNAGGVGGTPSYAGGEITATNQAITASDSGSGTSENLSGLLATNADIQAGDSGGPLVDANGQVVGMDTAGSSSNSGGFSFQYGGSATASQGFAIPIKTALDIAKKIESGTATSTVHIGATAFLGVDVSPGSASSNGFGEGGYFGRSGGVGTTPSDGALIEQAISGEPAANAGLQAGDTITSVAGSTVSDANALQSILLKLKPGRTVSVAYTDSAGNQETTTVTLASGPPQ